MKLKSFDWIIIIYQLLLMIIIGSYKNRIISIDYKFLLAAHIASIILIMFIIPKIKYSIFRNLYPFLLLPFLYNETGLLNHILYQEPQDEFFIKIDAFIFRENIGLTFCRHFASKTFSEIMHFFYFSYYLVLFIPAIWLLKKSIANLERYMFIVFLSFFLYYVIFIFYPVYGPEFYMNYLGESLKPAHLKGYYFTSVLGAILEHSEINGAAFPSSHVGAALIVFLIIKRYYKFFAGIIFVFFAGICLATVYCRAHYFIDVIGGIISGILFYKFNAFIYDYLIMDSKSEN